MSDGSEHLAVAAQALELVRAAAGADAQAEVSVERRGSALTRFANSFIHQNVADEVTTVRLRLHAGGRTAAGSTTRTAADGLRDLVTRTVDAARLAPPDPGWPGLAPPAAAAGEGDFDPATAAADPDARAARVRAFVDAAGGLETAGYCKTGYWESALANSAGQSVTTRTCVAAMDGIARVGRAGEAGGGSDGVARAASVRLAELDGAELGNRAAAKARAGADPVELPPGRYPVVLEPTAVADLLSNLALWGFNGKAYAERRAFAELGAEQFDRSVTLVDDPFAPGTPGFGFDPDGTPKRRLTLVDAGVTAAVVHDRRTAALAGGDAVSTGHRLPPSVAFLATLGAAPSNLGLQPGDGEAAPGPAAVDPAAADLIGQVERGLLVTDLWYTRVLDPKSLVVTGLTRNGVWLIEDGELAAPVRNLRFTQSYPQALGPGAVAGIGATARLLGEGDAPIWYRAPALHLASWHVTGGASG